MTEQEFEQLPRRFGPDVSLWPAPYRQEAMRFSGDASVEEDEALDRLVLEAALSETNEVALTQRTLAQINTVQKPTLHASFAGFWQMPIAASGFAALLLIAAIGGYMVAGENSNGVDDALLAFALGDSGTGNGVLEELGEEEQL